MSVALSFIIPIYKKKVAVLEKCLRSILDQSLTDYEIICVFDGPDPEGESVVRRMLKKAPVPVKVLTIEHGGAPKARNAGLAVAKGRYVVAWDADCYIEPHAAKAWVEILDRQPEYAFLYSSYKFADEKGATQAEPFDPWLLRVTNFISGCFPVRRELDPGWDESLESLQDWSRWLTIVERGGKGKFLQGYAFSTEYPDPESISGKGCTHEVWLSRMDKVREKHGIPKKKVCVTSLSNKMDGIALAKMLDADYMDRPNDKPNHYATIIQLGFSLNPGIAELHASAWGPEHKKILFWSREDVDEIYNAVSLNALGQYAERLNKACQMFVEDKAAQRIMEKAGFKVEILPLPMANHDEIAPLPEKPKFLIDASDKYGHAFSVLKRALPDMEIDVSNGITKLDECTGILHFYPERGMSSSAKRALLNGRHVVSNIQMPFCGYLDDNVTDETFIVNVVEKLRKVVKGGPNKAAAEYYRKALSVDKLKEVVA